MRYTSWDVLIFPEPSKTPLQEFKTACYVVQDPDASNIDSSYSTEASAINKAFPLHIPTVACFINNLPNDAPFRISIHSWEPPVPSDLLKSKVADENVCYEARVVVDGTCVAGVLFDGRGPWPQVLSMSCNLDKDGKAMPLKFPRFRPEMLSQTWWSAGEKTGRINVTIAEGFLRNTGLLPFVRTKNVVTFSFQHAPMHVLETSGIAWPNPGMWYNASQLYHQGITPVKPDLTNDASQHAHSPRRNTNGSHVSMEGVQMTEPSTSGAAMPAEVLTGNGIRSDEQIWNQLHEQIPRPAQSQPQPSWSLPIQTKDPFMGHRLPNMHDRGLSNSEDLPMPDSSRSETSAGTRSRTRDPSDASHVSYTTQYRHPIQNYEDRHDLSRPLNAAIDIGETLPQWHNRNSRAGAFANTHYPMHPANFPSQMTRLPAEPYRGQSLMPLLQGEPYLNVGSREGYGYSPGPFPQAPTISDLRSSGTARRAEPEIDVPIVPALPPHTDVDKQRIWNQLVAVAEDQRRDHVRASDGSIPGTEQIEVVTPSTGANFRAQQPRVSPLPASSAEVRSRKEGQSASASNSHESISLTNSLDTTTPTRRPRKVRRTITPKSNRSSAKDKDSQSAEGSKRKRSDTSPTIITAAEATASGDRRRSIQSPSDNRKISRRVSQRVQKERDLAGPAAENFMKSPRDAPKERPEGRAALKEVENV
ncbi:hypothetical protein MMC25_004744 [Agyrium rufum]|nr:hypothetical protein [Agyrium rufum]